MSGPTEPPRGPRYGSLDIWRGLACVSVVVFHACLFSYKFGSSQGVSGWMLAAAARGWVGVPIFFVISGYCILATADSARRHSHPTSQFFIRRFRRIFPPYWICLAATIAFTMALQYAGWDLLVVGDFGDIVSIPVLQQLHFTQWVGNLTLTETWRPHIVPPGTKQILGPAWTLCYEEQFYAVTGVLLMLAPHRIFLGAIIVSAAVILLTPFSGFNTGFFWDGRWLLFAAGIGVYYAINYAGRGRYWLVVAALMLGVAYDICRSQGWVTGPWKSVGLHRNEAMAAFGFALLLLMLHRWDVTISSSRLTQPFQFCGRMCYSLYLVHFPIVLAISHGAFLAGLRSATATIALTIPLCLAASLLAGWLFHIAVERHFLNRPGWQSAAMRDKAG